MVVIKQGAFGHWFIHHPDDLALGWSGSRWVPCDPDYGVPRGSVQVCNFVSKEDAEQYAREHGLL